MPRSPLPLLGNNGNVDRPTQTCSQCGRVGVRGFVTTEPTTVEIGGEAVTIEPITFCANTRACCKRWPKTPDHVLDVLYG